MTKAKKTIQIIIICVTLLTSVLVCILLPDTIAVQWNFSGVSNYMSKYIAAGVSVAVCILLICVWNSRYKNNSRGLNIIEGISSCVGIVLNIAFIIMN